MSVVGRGTYVHCNMVKRVVNANTEPRNRAEDGTGKTGLKSIKSTAENIVKDRLAILSHYQDYSHTRQHQQ